MKYKVGDRVYIVPIDEYGTIRKIRRDSRGSLIYDVERDDGISSLHVCRECELARTGERNGRHH